MAQVGRLGGGDVSVVNRTAHERQVLRRLILNPHPHRLHPCLVQIGAKQEEGLLRRGHRNGHRHAIARQRFAVAQQIDLILWHRLLPSGGTGDQERHGAQGQGSQDGPPSRLEGSAVHFEILLDNGHLFRTSSAPTAVD